MSMWMVYLIHVSKLSAKTQSEGVYALSLLCLGRVDTKPDNTSFRQNFTHPALKRFERRQPDCTFVAPVGDDFFTLGYDGMPVMK